MYNGGNGPSRPPTSQMPEMRYTNNASPRPPTGAAARPYTPGSQYDPVPQSSGAGQYYRPSTQGSAMTSHSAMPGHDFQEGRRPSLPTPAYERPSYSRQPSPSPFGYNESADDFHRGGYPGEETYPLTAYPAAHPGTPGTPYDGFEGDTGNST
jgi:hypothetical protein